MIHLPVAIAMVPVRVPFVLQPPRVHAGAKCEGVEGKTLEELEILQESFRCKLP